jgi:DNA polymerase III epsilon subunit-like protein
MIDTFPLSKTCLHFLPSYALEVIAKHLALSADNAHDAYADCVMNKDVFLHCITHLQKIRKEYLIFDYILQNSHTPLASILARTVKSYDFGKKELFLPPLVKAT